MLLIQTLVGWALIILFAAAPAIIAGLVAVLLLSGLGAVMAGIVGRRPGRLAGGLVIVGGLAAALAANIWHADVVARRAAEKVAAEQAKMIQALTAHPLPRTIAVWSLAPIDTYRYLGSGRFDEVWQVYGTFNHKDGWVELDPRFAAPPEPGGNRLVRHRLAETPGCRERLRDMHAKFQERQACVSRKGFLISTAALDQDHLLILRSGHSRGDGVFEVLRGASGRYAVVGRCEDNRRAPSATTYVTSLIDIGGHLAEWRHGGAYHRCIRQLNDALTGETTPPPKRRDLFAPRPKITFKPD